MEVCKKYTESTALLKKKKKDISKFQIVIVLWPLSLSSLDSIFS